MSTVTACIVRVRSMTKSESTWVLFLAWSLGGLASAEQYQALAPVLDVAPVYETRYEPVSREICTQPDATVREFGEIAPTIGEDVRRQTRLWQQQQRCRTVTEQRAREHVTGYRVTYRYNGETETTLLSYDPGKQMRVSVSLSPVR